MVFALILGDFVGIWTQKVKWSSTLMVFALILGDFAGIWTQNAKWCCAIPMVFALILGDFAEIWTQKCFRTFWCNSNI